MRAFNVATCIGCGACVAACPNGSASLFMGAKITHLGELPQGQPERDSRVVNMVAQHDHEGFGGCTNIGECTAACPKEIPLDVICQLNKDLRTAHASTVTDPPASLRLARPDSRPGGPVRVCRASGSASAAPLHAQAARTPPRPG